MTRHQKHVEQTAGLFVIAVALAGVILFGGLVADIILNKYAGN